MLLYFHGNGEDLGLLFELVEFISRSCRINVIAVEYPTYGIYKHSNISEERILEDASTVYKYVRDQRK
jgi:hypothetical protein